MKKILIVDDEESFCFFLKKNLESAGGFEVTACSDAGEAVGQAIALQPDLILLDILMPKITGPEVAELLHQNPKTGNIPVIFLTAVATTQDTGESNKVGGQFVVAKPVQIHELLKVIQKASPDIGGGR